MSRRNVSSGSPYEPTIGFSRAVRVGPYVHVSGTAPIGVDGRTVGIGDPYLQTKRCLEIIRWALMEAGGDLPDVVRTRVYLKDAGNWQDIARAHGEAFGSIRPASTFVQISSLLDPDWLVEIEAEAVLEEETAVPDGCLFCKILLGEADGAIVFEDANTVAFLDHRPVFPGHTLLIPRQHYETLPDLPAELVEPLFRNAQLLTRAVQQAMSAEGALVLVNNRVSQSVPHLHVHIVPRRKGDGLRGFLWPRQRYPDVEAERDIQSRIRLAIESLK